MKFLNQGYYFEPLGDGFVYRSTIFSAGYSVSSAEKDRLFAGLKRLEGRFLIEGFILVMAVAVVFMTGIVSSPTPIPWFILFSIGGVLLLAPAAVYRKRRLVENVLGRGTPDVPRLPVRQALTRPRPVIAKRYAIPVMRSIIGLLAFTTLVVDVLALVPIVAALLPQPILDQMAHSEAIAEALAMTLYNGTYWAVVAVVNVVLLVCIRLLIRELGRLRAMPDINDMGGRTPKS